MEQNLPYDTSMATADLGLIVYDGDLNHYIEFENDENIQKAYDEMKANNPIIESRKMLLKTSLRLTEKLAPDIYALGERCRQALGLQRRIEFFVYQDNQFNAACYPPDESSLYIMITSGLLEKFSEDELAFVIGHEIGHAIFGHHKYPAQVIMEIGDSYLSPLHAMKLFAWKRDAEITADRVGLLCCQNFEAAARTFFKLSSGVTTETLTFHLKEYISQFSDLKDEIENSEVDPEDWYSTHPFSPIRIKALELFNKSKTYHDLAGKDGGEITEEELEQSIKRIMSLMEPTYLDDESEAGAVVQEFLFLGGYMIAQADEEFLDSEMQALGSIINEEVYQEGMGKIVGYDPDEIQEELIGLSEKVNNYMSLIQKLNLIRDLAVISYADGEIVQEEMNVLYWLCQLLQIKPEFADHVIHEASQPAD